MLTILPSVVRHFHLIPEHVVYLLKEKMSIKFKVRCEHTPCFIAVLYVMHMRLLYALISVFSKVRRSRWHFFSK